eukprot:8991659-Pyramimonas_sp.AAC.1
MERQAFEEEEDDEDSDEDGEEEEEEEEESDEEEDEEEDEENEEPNIYLRRNRQLLQRFEKLPVSWNGRRKHTNTHHST